MRIFAQSEASANRRRVRFKLVDRADNLTPEPAINLVTLLGDMDVEKSDGSTTAAAGVVTEVGGGSYRYEFAQAELSLLGDLELKIDTAVAAIEVVQSDVRRLAQVYGHLHDGRVWLDTETGTAGAVPGVNATIDNPSDNIADAKTVADAFGYRHTMIAASFKALDILIDHPRWTFEGWRQNDLGGQSSIDIDAAVDIGGAVVRKCHLTGDLSASVSGGIVLEDGSASSLFNILVLVLRGNCELNGALSIAAIGGGSGIIQVSGTVGTGGTTASIAIRDDSVVVLQRIIDGDWSLNAIGDNAIVALAFESPGDVLLDGGIFASAVVTISNPRSFSRSSAPAATVVIEPGSVLEGLFLLLDQREYVQDGPNQLQTKCRRTSFANEVDRAATVPDDVGPFVEGEHALAIQTQYIESVAGANPGEPKQFKVRTL